MLEKLLKEIEDLKKAKELLNKVWIEMGPYRDGDIDDETWSKISEYMFFDDSEQIFAGVAQLVEQGFCKAQVAGS